MEQNLFRGPSQDLGWGRVFGGQVIGQAMSAAAQTVTSDPPRFVHSCHAYFLRAGDARAPIVYTVDPIRDGGSFTTRRVVAVQHGKPIFHLSASFQRLEEGVEHQDEMPDVVPPEELVSERDRAIQVADKIPPPLREMAVAERPLETRAVDPYSLLRPRARPPTRQVWFRAIDRLPDDDAVHRYLLGYASDFHFLGTSLQPHGVSWLTPGFQVASLDHAMWFHRPFRMDEWLLYDIQSSSASGARGLVRGRFFDRKGNLVASTVQEGLIRDRRPQTND